MKLKVVPNRGKEVILLYDGSPQEVIALRDAVKELSLNERTELNIERLPFIELQGDCRLTAKADKESRGILKNGSSDYTWLLSSLEWSWIAKLIEPLEKPWEGGHQYLHEGKETTVVISSGEGW